MSHKICYPETVGDLIDALREFPAEMPIGQILPEGHFFCQVAVAGKIWIGNGSIGDQHEAVALAYGDSHPAGGFVRLGPR